MYFKLLHQASQFILNAWHDRVVCLFNSIIALENTARNRLSQIQMQFMVCEIKCPLKEFLF